MGQSVSVLAWLERPRTTKHRQAASGVCVPTTARSGMRPPGSGNRRPVSAAKQTETSQRDDGKQEHLGWNRTPKTRRKAVCMIEKVKSVAAAAISCAHVHKQPQQGCQPMVRMAVRTTDQNGGDAEEQHERAHPDERARRVPTATRERRAGATPLFDPRVRVQAPLRAVAPARGAGRVAAGAGAGAGAAAAVGVLGAAGAAAARTETLQKSPNGQSLP